MIKNQTRSVLTITLNASIDKTYFIDKIVPGSVHHVSTVSTEAGGKGLNTARVLKLLQPHWNISSGGIIGGFNGQYIIQRTLNANLIPCYIEIPSESRVCINLVDTTEQSDTKINELGSLVTNDDDDRFIAMINKNITQYDAIALCGRPMPGSRDSIYKEVIEIAKRNNVLTALDSSLLPLSEGIKAHPDIVKINESEFCGWLNVDKISIQKANQAIRSLNYDNTQFVITLGGRGAIILGDTAYHAETPMINYISAVGCGDAFLAGYISEILDTSNQKEALKLAIACGASNAEHLSAGTINCSAVKWYITNIKIVAANPKMELSVT